MNYLENLNENQKKAVLTTEGPVRIIAGPGSGKTRTIVSKIIHVLENKLAKPDEIVVFTFTNKAANEIKERIASFLGYKFINVFTYHGWAARFLRIEAEKLGIDKDYRILDAYDQRKLVKEIMKEVNNETIDIKDALSRFSVYAFDNETMLAETKTKYYGKISNLYKLYVEKKKAMNSFDFDDLLSEVAKFLNENQDFRNFYTNKYKYIFVDEFQDTNKTQYSILSNITTNTSNITVVGDPDQNIYSWRGADVKIILNFMEDYPTTKTIVLSENYRSTVNIASVSNELINHNEDRISFDVQSVNEDGDTVKLMAGRNKFDEADQVVSEIVRLHRDEGIQFHEMAIIYRANYISRTFESELLKRHIGYQLIGGFKFFDRREIKETLQFLYFLFKKDDFTFRDIINIPTRGVGEKSLEKLQQDAIRNTTTIWEYVVNNKDSLSLKLKKFIESTMEHIERFDNKEDPTIVLTDYLHDIGFMDYYSLIEDKHENIIGLLEQLPQMFDTADSMADLFNWITLQSSSDKSTRKNTVTLITAHASKGLEYKVVFLVGFNEGMLPSKRSQTKKEIEEERRIAYVAITRAKKKLFLSYSHDIDYSTGEEMKPSSFIRHIQNGLNNYNNSGSSFSPINRESYFDAKQKIGNLEVGTMIIHKSYGKGEVVDMNDSFFTVKFKSVGIKELMKNHPSYILKENET